jgi:putative ABC transport system ATP-binding protein
MPATETPAIELNEVRFDYPDTRFALQIEGWTVDAGDQVACIGPSGSGKTTLLQLLAGTLLPSSGTIHVLGKELSGQTDRVRRAFRLRDIGMVWQEFALLAHLSVLENVLLPLRLDSSVTDLRSSRESAIELLRDVGLGDRIRQTPAKLSQGERQRVAIARALVRSPRLILADEPTGNLDPRTKQVIVELLQSHAEIQSATLVFVTHDHSLLPSFTNTVEINELNSHHFSRPSPSDA